MANSNTEHSRKLRNKTAIEAKRRKLQSGEYKAISLHGVAEDINYIESTIKKTQKKSKVKSILYICKKYNENN